MFKERVFVRRVHWTVVTLSIMAKILRYWAYVENVDLNSLKFFFLTHFIPCFIFKTCFWLWFMEYTNVWQLLLILLLSTWTQQYSDFCCWLWQIFIMFPPTYLPDFHDKESVQKLKYRQIGATDILASSLSFGASSLGGVFRTTDDAESGCLKYFWIYI